MVNHVEQTWRIAPVADCTLSDYLLYRRHLFAYEQACRLVGSWSVAVDLPCGLGYGIPLLKAGNAQVLAIDMADQSLTSIPDDPNVQRIKADAQFIPLASRSVDLVVAFQLIEHVSFATGVRILREMQRVLRPGGRGFVTTPNARWRLLPGQRPWNPFHVLEYTPRQILELSQAAGLPREALCGVRGVAGAQEIERRRVRQDPWSVYGGRLGGLGVRLGRLLRRWTVAEAAHGMNHGYSTVTQAEEQQDWFELTPAYEEGLDFWVEVRG